MTVRLTVIVASIGIIVFVNNSVNKFIVATFLQNASTQNLRIATFKKTARVNCTLSHTDYPDLIAVLTGFTQLTKRQKQRKLDEKSTDSWFRRLFMRIVRIKMFRNQRTHTKKCLCVLRYASPHFIVLVFFLISVTVLRRRAFECEWERAHTVT